MPIWDYKCSCDDMVLEKFVKLSDPPPKCEKCGEELTKLFSSQYKIGRGNKNLPAKERLH